MPSLQSGPPSHASPYPRLRLASAPSPIILSKLARSVSKPTSLTRSLSLCSCQLVICLLYIRPYSFTNRCTFLCPVSHQRHHQQRERHSQRSLISHRPSLWSTYRIPVLPRFTPSSLCLKGIVQIIPATAVSFHSASIVVFIEVSERPSTFFHSSRCTCSGIRQPSIYSKIV